MKKKQLRKKFQDLCREFEETKRELDSARHRSDIYLAMSEKSEKRAKHYLTLLFAIAHENGGRIEVDEFFYYVEEKDPQVTILRDEFNKKFVILCKSCADTTTIERESTS